MKKVEAFSDTQGDVPVRGYLHVSEVASGDGLVFAHGAGGNSAGAMLVAVAEAFAAAGTTVLRCDLPFRQSRATGPPRPAEAKRDREGLKCAVAALRKLGSDRVFLGGQSYGGRQATMLVSEEAELVDGMLLTSYPLHPPGKPHQLRSEHFSTIQVPALFVEGTRDPFGSVEEISAAVKLIPSRTAIMIVEGAGHDLGFSRGKAKRDFGAEVVAGFQRLMQK
ncbi:MAG: alpha/beta fold hydrolase [Acidobacteriales bacterium]|nr:alpha/beta fold hydrolase [Terriglobales bacterium]